MPKTDQHLEGLPWTPECLRMNDRQLGRLLAATLPTQGKTSSKDVKAVLRVLLETDDGSLARLSVPLIEMVSRPEFQALFHGQLLDGRSRLQCSDLRNILGMAHPPELVVRLNQVLDGFLEQIAESSHEPTRLRSLATHEISSPISESDVRRHLEVWQTPSTPSAPENVMEVEPQVHKEALPPRGPEVERLQRIEPPWWLIVAGTSVLSAIGWVVVQGNVLCSSLGFCSTTRIQVMVKALEEGEQAAAVLTKAFDLPSYEHGLSELERRLHRIESDAPLSDLQRRTRRRLQSQADQARARLKGEKVYQQSLRNVKAEGKAIQSTTRNHAKRIALLRRLEAIPNTSFSHEEAEALRRSLQEPPHLLRKQPLEPIRPQNVHKIPATRPLQKSAPVSTLQAPPADGGGSTAPNRDEPLWESGN
jgi:hypothetical protein